uniref:Bacteriocin maturation protein n=2 Tax=Cohnella candidum TaxID=2674991 RepID=A0A3G3K506_9BACL|nr:bacteriocin maturation protein [Cohnella candidum]
MRPKVTGDTFFLPDPDGIVYFRNNRGSFRMEGAMIDRWIEQLIPVFDGRHTLASLTEGLPEPHRKQVYEIAESLHSNGYVRDVSQDHPHRLPDGLLAKFAAQIDFLDAFGGSGASRFQAYRESKVLAAGSGPMLVCLVASLLESGLSRFRFWAADLTPAEQRRIEELAAYARLTDPEVRVEPLVRGKDTPWVEAVSGFDGVVYASPDEEGADFKALQAACLKSDVTLLPAIIVEQIGMAGPLITSGSSGDWTSARRRLHRSETDKDPRNHAPSAVAEAMLADVVVFEMFKSLTGVGASDLRNRVYLLNLETLEGTIHQFLPITSHAELAASPAPPPLLARPSGAEAEAIAPQELFAGFSSLTSPVTGIFHAWDEADYRQLPLSVCRVQAVYPGTKGSAEPLPEIVCGGLTHERARREAGLAGIEAYAARRFRESPGFGVGAGASVNEAMVRALLRCLDQRLEAKGKDASIGLKPYTEELRDEELDFYFTALNTVCGKVEIFEDRQIVGFPVFRVSCAGTWYKAAGIRKRDALEGALIRANLSVQTASSLPADATVRPALPAEEARERLDEAIAVLKRQGLSLQAYDLAAEPFMKQNLAGVFGVVLREEGTP